MSRFVEGSAAPSTSASGRPEVLSLRDAADGALAQLRLPGGRLRPAGLEAIAAAAAHGSGLIELTPCACIRIRGLRADAAAPVAAALDAGGLLPSPAHDHARNVLASPLAGRLPGAVSVTDAVVAAIDRGLCADHELAALPGRFLFAVEDGSGTLGPQDADVALQAEPGAVTGDFRLYLAGLRTTLRAHGDGAARLALAAARAFLALLPRDDASATWRLSDVPDGACRLARALGGAARPRPAHAPDARRAVPGRPVALGTCEQADGLLAVTVMPRLARTDRSQARRLARLARATGGELRLSPWRTLTFVDVRPVRAERLTLELSALGFVVSERSGWHGLSACPGLGACAHARVDVRSAAARRAGQRGPASPAEHWSACERGCGQPAGAPVGVTATANGLSVSDGGGARSARATVDDAIALLSGGGRAAG